MAVNPESSGGGRRRRFSKRLLLPALVLGIPLVYTYAGSGENVMDSTDLHEQICTLLSAGFKQRQIAVYLGIGQATVSDHKRALVAAGRLPESQSTTTLDTYGEVVELQPESRVARRTRVAILLEHAELKASALRATARNFAEHVVGADEWVTDPDFREQVRAVAADAVGEAIEHLERIAIDLGLLEYGARSASAGHRGAR